MKRFIVSIALFLPIFLVVSSVQADGSDFSLVARHKTSSINIFEGALFNDYPISHFELKAEWNWKGIELFASPYTYFRTAEPGFYTEVGLIVGAGKKIGIAYVAFESMFVGWREEGKVDRGVVLIGELDFDVFMNPRIVYLMSNIIGREDLNGSSIRLDFGGRIATIKHKGKKVGVVESSRGLIYNNRFFRDRKGFVLTADVSLKEVRIFGSLTAELFVNWAYWKKTINELMVGININLPILGKEE